MMKEKLNQVISLYKSGVSTEQCVKLLIEMARNNEPEKLITEFYDTVMITITSQLQERISQLERRATQRGQIDSMIESEKTR